MLDAYEDDRNAVLIFLNSSILFDKTNAEENIGRRSAHFSHKTHLLYVYIIYSPIRANWRIANAYS